jgi:hypothetical protein
MAAAAAAEAAATVAEAAGQPKLPEGSLKGLPSLGWDSLTEGKPVLLRIRVGSYDRIDAYGVISDASSADRRLVTILNKRPARTDDIESAANNPYRPWKATNAPRPTIVVLKTDTERADDNDSIKVFQPAYHVGGMRRSRRQRSRRQRSRRHRSRRHRSHRSRRT